MVVAGRSAGAHVAPTQTAARPSLSLPGASTPRTRPPERQVVLVKYASLQDEYQFKTQLMEVSPSRWLMAIPRHSANRPSTTRRNNVAGNRCYDSVAQTRWDIENLVGERLVPGGD